jgi:hypothetical protein
MMYVGVAAMQALMAFVTKKVVKSWTKATQKLDKSGTEDGQSPAFPEILNGLFEPQRTQSTQRSVQLLIFSVTSLRSVV